MKNCYGCITTRVANQRDKNKKQVSFWATEEERKLLTEAAKKANFPNVTEYLRWISFAQPKPGEMPKMKPKGEDSQE